MKKTLKGIEEELTLLQSKGINEVELIVKCSNDSGHGVFAKKFIGELEIIKDKDRANSSLTDRELEVLELIVKGKSNTEIAEVFNFSVHTAKAHVCNILQKLDVDDRVQAAVKAVKEDLI